MTLIRRGERRRIQNATEEEFHLSRRTKVKTEIAQKYIEEHYKELFKEVRERNDIISKLDMCSDDSKQNYFDEETKMRRFYRNHRRNQRYEKIKQIGKGGFSEVWLAMDKYSNKLYAIKILSKNDVIRKDQIQNVRLERDILKQTDNRWIIHLHSSFQDTNHLYFVLDYIPGGDLMTALIKMNRFSENTARFFAGEILIALHSIHDRGVLHRDLKPDNVLIDEDGHIKLADFGLSQTTHDYDSIFDSLKDELFETDFQAQPKTNRKQNIGTIEYTAPEVFNGREVTEKSDYWSLGVILYEMLYGFNPFFGKSQQETAFRILKWKTSLRFPKDIYVSEAAIDLIKRLLCDSEDRLGFEEILTHRFFSGFDFEDYINNKPPFIPSIKYPTDTSHFEEFESGSEDTFSGDPYSTLSKFAFAGFTIKERTTAYKVFADL